MFISVKPLSVNEAYTGRRFKTDKHREWCKEVAVLLPLKSIPDGPLRLDLTFGYSSHAADIDNGLKTILDALQKKYGFNDNRIYELHVWKDVVPKGKEFIDIHIKPKQ